MEVEIGGSPVPEVHWYFNEKEMIPGANSEFNLRRLGCHATLIIETVKVKTFSIFNLLIKLNCYFHSDGT